MRTWFILAGLALGAGVASGAGKTAARVYDEGRKAERSGDIVRAYLFYSQAAAMDAAKPEYWLRSRALRARATMIAKPKPQPFERPKDSAPPTGLVPAVLGTVSAREIDESRKPQPPLELNASPGRRNLDFRGNSESLFEQVGRAYGLEAVTDAEYQPGPVRSFRMDGADYREALHALEAATGSFVTPLSERLLLVAKDTPQKRIELELSATVAVPLPDPVSLQEAQEIARTVQQALQMTRVTVDSQRRIVLLRDRVSKVRPAQELFRQMMRRRAQVAIEMDFLEVSSNSTANYGLSLPTSFPLAYLGSALNSKPSLPQGAARLLRFGGGWTLFGIGVMEASAFAQMSSASARHLLRTEIRSLDGQEASIHVGDKYPIITSTFLTQSNTGTQGVFFPPAFNFEDLGLLLKVTPHVHGMMEVTLDLNAEFKVLAGEGVSGIPVIANRKLEAKVRLKNDQYAAVAGLMSASEARSITGPAGLSSLPVIGPVIRNNDRSSEHRNVLLILRPTLLSPPPDQEPVEPVFVGSETRPRTAL